MAKNKFVGYHCSLCGKEYGPDEATYVCPQDGGNLDVILDYEGIRKKYRKEDVTSRTDFSMWRYLPLLPVNDPEAEGTSMGVVGWTPVYTPRRLADKLGLQKLWIKDDGRNPSASFKDRASALLVARAREINADVIVTASTGNAGAALACMAAAVGHKAVIFAPKTAPQAKVAQLLVFGAQVILVDGNYDMAFDLSIQAAQTFGWYCRNTGYNPFTAEGKKTAAFEIWEMVMENGFDSNRPLNVFVSVGDGNIISGLHKGFKDLYALGWMENITPVSATTIADSISVDLPRDGVRAVRAATQTGGKYITVKDEEIIAAIAELGKVAIFAEPAGATAYAGLCKAVSEGHIGPEDPVLVMNTGSGLKDVRAAMQAVKEAPIIEPSMDALKKHLGI
jgi:threonine synthase